MKQKLQNLLSEVEADNKTNPQPELEDVENHLRNAIQRMFDLEERQQKADQSNVS